MRPHRISSVLAVAAFLVGCQDQLAVPFDVLEPELKKGGAPGPPDAVQYEFVYPVDGDDLGSDCLHQPDLGFGRTFWCDKDEPTFVLQVVAIDSDGLETPVEQGTVTFVRCETLSGYPVDWVKCGSNKKQYKKYFQEVYYGEDNDLSGGLAQLTLAEFWLLEEPVWGMHWEYDVSDGNKPEADIKWRRLAYEGYTYPPTP
jgi:hypothetical protein